MIILDGELMTDISGVARIFFAAEQNFRICGSSLVGCRARLLAQSHVGYYRPTG